ncbi:MAG: hypothetical protein QF578_23805 [Alphaproteobacteria bacterium]|jgi:hypothetical protein|nr:hypothetical protein [Alphaproteobacteria bacterium]MDP6567871.1 hypothetical protein [Alphaproteobacteria bacterium]MDP6813123.1 hypothetical protein [Alphaproteobacteria bacterium]
MAFILRSLVRYAARRIAADPRAREAAAKTLRTATDEAKKIAASDDRARAAGRAVRKAMDKLQGEP